VKQAVAGWCRSHLDDLLTVAVLAIMLVSTTPTGHWPSGLAAALIVAVWAPLTIRRRWPLPVAVVVVALDTVRIAAGAHAHPAYAPLPVATMLALYTMSERSPARVLWSAAAISAVAQLTVAVLSLPQDRGPDFLYLNWSLLAAVIGRLTRERRERIAAAEQRAEEAEQGQAAEARRQVTAERLRIARDLHDMLAHHITVVNAQASVAQYLLKSDPDAAEQALDGIAANTRAALDELRATLGLLRSDGDADQDEDDRAPSPGTGQLPALVASFNAAGTKVSVHQCGTARPLGAPAGLALYRIAQEALTNASKHAPGSTAQLDLSWADAAVTLTITNTPSAHRPGRGTGHGLIGMRERAASAGGTLVAGPVAAGGYQVVATLPVSTAGEPQTTAAAAPCPAPPEESP
jgi:signal transduction histidine kinase